MERSVAVPGGPSSSGEPNIQISVRFVPICRRLLVVRQSAIAGHPSGHEMDIPEFPTSL